MIDAYLAALSERAPSNVADLHAYLVREHDYPGSLRSVQRYVRATFPPPKIRARRRVETPPGAQAQVDWAHFPGVLLGGRQIDLLAFSLVLSWSRADVLVWSPSKDQLAWLSCHNQGFERIQGVPATVRIDYVACHMIDHQHRWAAAEERQHPHVRHHPILQALRSAGLDEGVMVSKDTVRWPLVDIQFPALA